MRITNTRLYDVIIVIAIVLFVAALLLGQASDPAQTEQTELVQRKNRSGTVVYARPINKTSVESIPADLKIHKWEELAFDLAGCFEWIDPSNPNPHPITDCKKGQFKYLRIRICRIHEEVRVRVVREQ